VNDSYVHEYGRTTGSQGLLHSTRVTFTDPAVVRLQREVAVHRMVLWAYFGVMAVHFLWDNFPP
jgi:hypothetical protein